MAAGLSRLHHGRQTAIRPRMGAADLAASGGREIIRAALVPRFLRIPLSGLAFLLFYAGAAVIAWVLLPLHRRRHRHLSEADQRQALDHFMMRIYRASVEMMGAFRLMDFSLPDFKSANLPPPPWVLVANHPSLIDVHEAPKSCDTNR